MLNATQKRATKKANFEVPLFCDFYTQHPFAKANKLPQSVLLATTPSASGIVDVLEPQEIATRWPRLSTHHHQLIKLPREAGPARMLTTKLDHMNVAFKTALPRSFGPRQRFIVGGFALVAASTAWASFLGHIFS